MIDLAPNHKHNLLAANPILLAGGTIGYGEACHPALDLRQLGGVVVAPLLLHSRAGSPPPRLTSSEGGFTLDTGLQNRGLDAVLRNFAKLWPKLGCPVVVQLADSEPNALRQVAARLNEIEGVAALELLLPRSADAQSARALLRAVAKVSDLPLWVKPSLDHCLELAPIAVQNQAAAVVVGQSPQVAHSTTAAIFGPVLFERMLAVLHQTAKLQLDCALLACGGIHTPEDVGQALAAGARAVQIDSAVWVEPTLPAYLAQCITIGGICEQSAGASSAVAT
jgi:dihydroorotate dehydrogenase (NAD+) catalytic subunit